MRRLHCSMAAFLELLLVAGSYAADFPNKPVRLIVPFTAGGSPDQLARRLAIKMSDHWGQQVVVDNRTGAGGTIGVDTVAKARPDGYTLLVHSVAFATSAALYPKLPYDALKDFAPISHITTGTGLLLVAPTLGVKSVKELIELAKQKPGQINVGSSGVGSGTHFNAEQFRIAADIQTVHIPYKGIPELIVDVMAGRTQFFFTSLSTALPYIRDGRLVALGVIGARRTPILPDVPTIAEAALPGYEFNPWFGMFAPAKTPPAIVEQISKEVARFVKLPDMEKQFVSLGEEGVGSTPEEFTRLVRAEVEKYTKIIKLAGIKVE